MVTNIILDNLRNKLHILSLKPMQERMLETKDHNIALVAPTGSGKTIAFSIYLLRRLNEEKERCQGLIIVPTRELALQVSNVLRPLATGYKTVTLYGGHKMEDETNSLNPLPDIIVATPGRLLDHLQRKNLSLNNPTVLILDEYDKSLELGFEKEMKSIYHFIRKPQNVILTSATILSEQLPDWIEEKDFTLYDYRTEEEPKIEKIHIESPSKDKAEILTDLLNAIAKDNRTVVFVNHRESAERLYNFLKKAGIECGIYHGGLSQHDRETSLALFENGTYPILIATDLASRGLDIEGIDSVIHYHLPPTQENWTHRNGRTARNGKSGRIYIISSESDTIPDYVIWDREWLPKARGDSFKPIKSKIATLHINAGKKEKISRGDIVGYLITKGQLQPEEIGKIKITDHEALVAVPKEKARDIILATGPYKLKNKKVKITQIKH